MKKNLLLLLSLVICFQLAYAQLPNNVERIGIEVLESLLTAKPGEFQIDYKLYSNASSHSVSEKYNYVYIARNDVTGMSYICNQEGPLLKMKYQVRPFRLGSIWQDCICVVKYFEKESFEIGYAMEVAYAYGKMQEKCDSIVMLSDDGFVYRLRDNYYYRTYKGRGIPEKCVRIVWPETHFYQQADKALLSSNKVECVLSEGDVYHYCPASESYDAHYYYLYQDKYMARPVLVVDGDAVQLYGDCKEEDLMFKYSYNGNHWMAVVGDRFWVDGVAKYAGDFVITDFLITDNGDYYYKASKKGEDGKGELIVINGQVVRRQTQIGYFGLDAQQKLVFHFLSGGQWYVYSNGVINGLCDDNNAICYSDDLREGLVVKQCSDDMKHTLSYVIGEAGITIDNVTLGGFVPFQARFDKTHNCFCWNAIEWNKEGKAVLVLYKYNIENNFIKNMFR